MKKLTILVVIMLVAGLLAGCWVLPESKLISITVDPESMDLETGETESIISVTANYNDGTSEDIKLTDCEYCTYDCQVAKVNAEGLVIAVGKGETEILVTYTQKNFWTGRVTVTEIVGVFVEELANQAPIITSEPILNAKWFVKYVYDVEADDPDGDILTYSLTVSPTSSDEKYVMTIEPSTGVIEWVPSWDHLGFNQVIVEVTDGELSDTQSFTVTVVN